MDPGCRVLNKKSLFNGKCPREKSQQTQEQQTQASQKVKTEKTQSTRGKLTRDEKKQGTRAQEMKYNDRDEDRNLDRAFKQSI